MDGIGMFEISNTLLNKQTQQYRLLLKPIQMNEKKVESKISAWSKIRSRLQMLLDKADTLKNDTFHAVKISENKAFEAFSENGNSIAGFYNIKVNELAQHHTIAFNTKKGMDTLLGNNSVTRTLKISQKGEKNKENLILLTKEETSLAGIAKAINNKKAGVHATIQNLDNKGTLSLVLRAEKAGIAGEMTVFVNGDDSLNKIMEFNSKIKPDESNEKMKQTLQAIDAKIIVDGNEYIRSSNRIDDVIPGIILRLKKKSKSDESEILILEQEKNIVQKGLEEFIKVFNEFIIESSSFNKFKSKSHRDYHHNNQTSDENLLFEVNNGPLAGEGLLSNLTMLIRRGVGSYYGDHDITSITSLGINVNSKTGELLVNNVKLRNIINNNPNGVKKFFLGTEEKKGMIDVISDHIKSYIGKKDNTNIIGDELVKLEKQKREIKKDLERKHSNINKKIQVYHKQYQRMEIKLAQLEWLNAPLSAIQMVKKNNFIV